MNISRECRVAEDRNALAMRKSEEKVELLLYREWRRDAAGTPIPSRRYFTRPSFSIGQ
jgi:hypothetical protein